MVGYKIISSDSHVIEPPDIWTDRIEPKYRDRAPQVVHEETGDFWYIDGIQTFSATIGGSRSGDRFEGKLDVHMAFLGDVRPGGYIPRGNRSRTWISKVYMREYCTPPLDLRYTELSMTASS